MPDDPPKTIKPSRRSVILMVLVALVGVLAILYAWQLWPFGGRVAVTENAYVRGQITVLAPQVNGYVTEVRVQDFEAVQQGQPLVQIDDRQYRQIVEQRRAELAARRFELENLEQTLASNRATLASRRAELAAAEAELQRVRTDERRVNELAERGSVSIRERDQVRATARADSAQVAQARAAIAIAEQTLKASEVSAAACRRRSKSPKRTSGAHRSTWTTPGSLRRATAASAKSRCARASTSRPVRSCSTWCRSSAG